MAANVTMGLTSRWFNENGREVFNVTAAQRLRLRDQFQGIADGAAVQTERLSDVLLGGAYNPSDRWRLDGVAQLDQDTNRYTRVTARCDLSPRELPHGQPCLPPAA